MTLNPGDKDIWLLYVCKRCETTRIHKLRIGPNENSIYLICGKCNYIHLLLIKY